MAKSKHTESIAVRVPIPIGDAIRAEAQRQGISVSAFLNALIQSVLGNDANAFYVAVRAHGYEFARELLNRAHRDMPASYDEALVLGLVEERQAPPHDANADYQTK